MLFKIDNLAFKVPILCVVSADGCLFLKAADVWRNKGYVNTFRKVKENCKTCVKDLVYKKWKLPVSLLKTKVYDLEEAKKILSELDCLKDARLGYQPLQIPFPTFRPKCAYTANLIAAAADNDDDSTEFKTFDEFFRDFVEMTMEFYEENCAGIEDHPFPVMISDYVTLPPRKIKIFTTKNSWIYKRCRE